MEPFFSAIKFLTIFPVPESWAGDENTLKKSVYFYPAVGLLIGVCLMLSHIVLSSFLPDALVVISLMGCSALLTGALHLDGLADTADGLFSSRSRERMLEIMRDSNIGVMGVLSVIFIVAMKGMVLFYLPEKILWQTLLLFPIAGRVSLLLHWSLLDYVRDRGGIASIFEKEKIIKAAAAGILIIAVAGIITLGKMGIYALGIMILYTLLISLYVRYKIGGMTGDTLGAVCESSEAVFLIGIIGISL